MTTLDEQASTKNNTTEERVIKNAAGQVKGITLFACLKDDQQDRFIILLQEPVSNRKRKKVYHLLNEKGIQSKVLIFSDSTRKLVNRIFHPFKVKNIQYLGRQTRDRIHVFFHPDDYPQAVTAGNKYLAQLLLGRYHGIRTIKYFSTYTKSRYSSKWMKLVSHGGGESMISNRVKRRKVSGVMNRQITGAIPPAVSRKRASDQQLYRSLVNSEGIGQSFRRKAAYKPFSLDTFQFLLRVRMLSINKINSIRENMDLEPVIKLLPSRVLAQQLVKAHANPRVRPLARWKLACQLFRNVKDYTPRGIYPPRFDKVRYQLLRQLVLQMNYYSTPFRTGKSRDRWLVYIKRTGLGTYLDLCCEQGYYILT